MGRRLQELIGLLDLEEIDTQLYRAQHPQGREHRLYGGQIMAQALMAASRTVAGAAVPQPVHSLHGYFLRPGDPRVPTVIQVERLRDGRSFCTRRVVVLQQGEAIFNMDASFQVAEAGFQHQFEMPNSRPPAPQNLPAHLLEDAFISWREDYRRLVSSTPQPPYQHVWFRANGKVPADPVLQACLLVYESDGALLGTARLPHRGRYDPQQMQSASLDHAIWFHHPVDVSGWLLYVLDAPSSAGGCSYNRGSVYTADGLLVASTAQEGLMRLHRTPSRSR